MSPTAARPISTFLALTTAISRSRTVDEICSSALDALATGLGVERASILLFDPDGVMRFKAYRGLSDAYRRAVEGHTPWQPDTRDPHPIWVSDVAADSGMAPYHATFAAEGIAAMAFIPLTSRDRVIGKFMLYFAAPTPATGEALELAGVIAAQVAFALDRTATEQQARRSEERLRFALDAAAMGTWDWDLRSNAVQWSDNLAAIHGLPDGAFDGTFSSYEREIHPDDRGRVLASIQRALGEGIPHEVEYRLVAPDGTIRWCEGKGRVEYEDGAPARMTGVCMMVTRRKEAELARLAAAEEASRLKDEFLATLSHELRTPLNAILGWAQMLQSGQLSLDRARQAIDVIGRNAKLQAQLIEDILDVSRIITGKLDIERVPIAVAPLLEAALNAIAPVADARRLVIRRDIAPDIPAVHGDPKRLDQVLNNVLSNAVKFTPDGGVVEVRCQAGPATVELEVRDTGIGIASEFLPYVFDRFRQADSRSTRVHGGLGLGLAIARHLVEQHGGTIRAESKGPGTGTTIRIALPVLPHVAAAPVREALPEDAGAHLAPLEVLVVDDERDSREMLAALLEGRGARVTQRDSAEGALEALRNRPFHVLIADIAMPQVDGYELLRRLRSSGDQTPAIAVTAFARSDDRQRALACGYTSFMAKPVDGNALAGAVAQLAARQ